MKLGRSLLLLYIAGVLSCSTAKPIGVRKNFQNVGVKKIAVMAVFSTGKFSLEKDEFEKLRKIYANALNTELRRLEFQIVDRKMIDVPLSDSEKLALDDGLGLPKSLDILFETDKGEHGAETAIVRRFYAAKTLPAHILFAEIVYHSRTVCQESAEQSNAYAQINDKKITLPSACILAHFQAKLIDSKTGQPMWSNHVFLEYRLNKSSENEPATSVIENVVQKTLSGDNGIVHLR